jgi:hypothetical protein
MIKQEEINKRFDDKFYEGERNSVFCKEHKTFATPHEIKEFIYSEIKKAESEERKRILEIANGFTNAWGDEIYPAHEFIKLI